MIKKKFYINGQWVAPKSPKEIQVIDPATEKSCAVISSRKCRGCQFDAVTSAKKALETWAFTSKEERVKLLEGLYDSI